MVSGKYEVHALWLRKLNLESLYSEREKHRGKARIVASVWVTIASEQTVKIVFVRNRRNNDWLAILSTNAGLADTEIVRIYGKRWDIEVFFKTLVANALRNAEITSEEFIENIIDDIMGTVLEKMNLNIPIPSNLIVLK